MSRIERGLGAETIVEPSNEVMLVEGELRQGTNIAMSKERFEEYRLGYRCHKCHQVQDEPFPDVCKARDLTGTWRCGFRMRDDQLRFLEAAHQGEQRYGPSPLDDVDYEQENWTPASRIWVPGKPI